MKIASIVLKIVAVLGAAFCVYAWLDTRGKISTAETHMKDVQGTDVVSKAANVPGILKNLAAEKQKVAGLQKTVVNMQSEADKINSELESERAKNVKASAEISKKDSELRTVKANLESEKKVVAEKDVLIENLKKEIVASKQMLTQNNEVEPLKEKIATLESQLAASQKELEEESKKAKLLELSEVVEVIETDAEGRKIKRKIVKTPYIPTGDIATVISMDQTSKIIAINKGTAANVKKDQKILLKRDGKDISEIMITESYPEYSVAMVNREFGFPETIEANDMLEMCSPVKTAAMPTTVVPPASGNNSAAPAAEKDAEAPAENAPEQPAADADGNA